MNMQVGVLATISRLSDALLPAKFLSFDLARHLYYPERRDNLFVRVRPVRRCITAVQAYEKFISVFLYFHRLVREN